MGRNSALTILSVGDARLRLTCKWERKISRAARGIATFFDALVEGSGQGFQPWLRIYKTFRRLD